MESSEDLRKILLFLADHSSTNDATLRDAYSEISTAEEKNS